MSGGVSETSFAALQTIAKWAGEATSPHLAWEPNWWAVKILKRLTVGMARVVALVVTRTTGDVTERRRVESQITSRSKTWAPGRHPVPSRSEDPHNSNLTTQTRREDWREVIEAMTRVDMRRALAAEGEHGRTGEDGGGGGSRVTEGRRGAENEAAGGNGEVGSGVDVVVDDELTGPMEGGSVVVCDAMCVGEEGLPQDDSEVVL